MNDETEKLPPQRPAEGAPSLNSITIPQPRAAKEESPLLSGSVLNSLAFGLANAPASDVDLRMGFTLPVPEHQRPEFDELVKIHAHAVVLGERGQVEKRKADLRRNATAEAELRAEKHAADLEKLDARSKRLDAFLMEPPSGQRYDVQNLLPGDGNSTLCAPKKIGKTTMMGEVIRSFADGEPFLAQFAVQPAVVGVWDYEMGDDQHRIWLGDLGIRNTRNVHRLSLRGVGPSFRSEEFRKWAVEWLRSRGIQVWILDPAHRAATGYSGTTRDPNEAVQEFTEELERVKEEAGVRNIVLPIHTGLHGEHARGAARWGDWPDAIWTLKKDDAGLRTLSAEGRDVDLPETPLCFDRETRLLTVSPFDSFAHEYRPTDVDRVCRWLRENPGVRPSKNLIIQKLRMGHSKGAAAIEEAESEGRILIRKGPRNSHQLWLPEEWDAHEREQKEASNPILGDQAGAGS
jgi:hypothetical protein